MARNRTIARRVGNSGNQVDPVAAFESAVESHSPLVWLKLNETEGLVAVNSGSGGVTYDGTISGTTTLGEASDNEQIGTGYLADAATSLIQLEGTDATLQGIPTNGFTFMVACKVLGTSEGTVGVLVTFDASNNLLFVNRGDGTELQLNVPHSTTTGIKRTNASQAPLNTLYWAIARYDAATKAIDIEIGQNGALSTPTLQTDTAAAGTVNNAIGDMCLLANRLNAQTLNGLNYTTLVYPTRLTDEQLTEIVVLSGV